MREAHTSRIVGHFGVTKIVAKFAAVCVLAKDAGVSGEIC